MDKPRKSPRARKSSEDRVARKREQDRQAQRSAREKTKALISQLESRIDILSKFHDSGNVKNLLDELERQRSANETLRATLGTIEKVIGSGIAQTNALCASQSGSKVSDNLAPSTGISCCLQPPSNSTQSKSNGNDATDSACASPVPNLDVLENMERDRNKPIEFPDIIDDDLRDLDFHNHIGPHGEKSATLNALIPTPSMPHFSPLCECCKSILDLNSLLGEFTLPCNQRPINQREMDADIPIRAVLHGWTVVESLYTLDTVWTIIRVADESIWRHCGVVERLAILRVVSAMLRYRTDPSDVNSKALPIFMRQRPSQERIVHKPLIDFIVWPGLRERLVMYPHQHCSAKFWNLFWDCFRFDWPYALEDVCFQHCQTGLYQFSGTFSRHFFDLQRWRMMSRFVEEFPDLEPDVLVVPSLAGSASPALDDEGFLTGLEGLVHADEPQFEAFPASFFTDLQAMDWPTS